MHRTCSFLLLVPLSCALAFAQRPTDAQRLAAAINTFARDVHGRVAATEPPITSPTSLAVSLAMLLSGARGATGEEIAATLHLPADLRGARLNAAVAELLEGSRLVGVKINAPVDVPPPVLLVDDIWVAKDAPLQPDFVATLRRSFSGGIETIDFADDPQAARATINAAIARTTHGRIRELVPDGTINAATRVVLTNALRLHAAWKDPFLPQATTDSPFTLTDGTRVQVPTMRGELEDGFAETDAVQALSMRLAEVEVRCEIVVPKAGHSIADAERALFGAGYALRSEKVDVNLPRFQVRGVHRLSPVLQALGMKAAFDPQRADFGGMTTATPLFVGDVVHEAWVKIDEQGVEAAAATAVVAVAGAKWPPEPPKVFRADRAFLFALRHAVTGLLLFVGRVDDPRRKD